VYDDSGHEIRLLVGQEFRVGAERDAVATLRRLAHETQNGRDDLRYGKLQAQGTVEFRVHRDGLYRAAGGDVKATARWRTNLSTRISECPIVGLSHSSYLPV